MWFSFIRSVNFLFHWSLKLTMLNCCLINSICWKLCVEVYVSSLEKFVALHARSFSRSSEWDAFIYWGPCVLHRHGAARRGARVVSAGDGSLYGNAERMPQMCTRVFWDASGILNALSFDVSSAVCTWIGLCLHLVGITVFALIRVFTRL